MVEAGPPNPPLTATPEDRAKVILDPTGLSALSIQTWGSEAMVGTDGPKANITTLFCELRRLTERVQSGCLGDTEAVLAAQATVLNVLFANLLARAHQTRLMDHIERFMRLALKAQSQCRATCETLALLKNPPVFARQANIANGPQQVNNGPVLNDGSARAEIASRANKLLESSNHGEDLDTETSRPAIVRDSALASLGKINGPMHAGRKARVSRNAFRGGNRTSIDALSRMLKSALRPRARISLLRVRVT